MRKLAPILLALASLSPAQTMQLLDASLVRTTTVIDWGGQPAIVLLVQGENPFVVFPPPGASNPSPRLSLRPVMFGAYDARPCATGSKVSVGLYDLGLIPTVPVTTGVVLWSTHPRVCPSEITWYPGTNPFEKQRWAASYCSQTSCQTPCGTVGQAPQWSALVCLVGVR